MRELPRTLASVPSAEAWEYPASYFATRYTAGVSTRDLDRLKIGLVQSGRAELHGEFGALEVSAGDLLIIPPGLSYSGIILEPGEVLGVAFDFTFLLEQVRLGLPRPDPNRQRLLGHFRSVVPTIRTLHPTRPSQSLITRELSRLLHEAPTAPTGARIIGATRLVWLLAPLLDPTVSRRWVLRDVAPPRPLRLELRLLLELLQRDVAAPWTVAEMARQVSLSESALHRAFRAELATSPRDYLQLLRVSRFDLLLRTTDLSIAEAAQEVGWASTGHASRTFREMNGTSPREHRARVRYGAVPLQLPDVWGA